MTVADLLERIPSSELLEWAVIFEAEDAEAKKRADEMRRKGRGR